MSRFNPDFWEVVVERARLEAATNEDALWHEYNRSRPDRELREQRTREAFRHVNEMIRTELTARQRQVVRLHYFAGLSEEEIADRLGIAQQVVSQHRFGIMRNGRRVGGAIPRLRKLYAKCGIEW
jgi:RNA polymerase sigma factor (sigma-70 family)